MVELIDAARLRGACSSEGCENEVQYGGDVGAICTVCWLTLTVQQKTEYYPMGETEQEQPRTTALCGTLSPAPAPGVAVGCAPYQEGTGPLSDLPAYDGAYRYFVPPGDYRVHIHRHGQPWLVVEKGCKAVLALMMELEEARAKLAAADACANCGTCSEQCRSEPDQ